MVRGRDGVAALPATSFLFDWRFFIASKDSSLTPTERHVALTLSLHMNREGGSCYPSILTIAEETGWHRATVIRALAEIARKGYLKRRRGHNGRPTRYQALYPPFGVVAQDDLVAQDDVAQDDGVVAQDDLGSRTVRHEDVKEDDNRASVNQEHQLSESSPSSGELVAMVDPVEVAVEVNVVDFVDGCPNVDELRKGLFVPRDRLEGCFCPGCIAEWNTWPI